jgi:DNA-binding PadR family transcriptional regulator
LSVKYALLGILSEESRHGYEIKRAFDEKMGEFWNLNVGQIYSTLEKLEGEGLIEHSEIAQQDKPDKKVYRITDSGLEDFNDWRTRPIKAEPRTLRDELFVKILFMDPHDPQSVLSLIKNHQSVYLAYMMRLTERKYQQEQQVRKGLTNAKTEQEREKLERDRLLNAVLIDAALFHAEADIRWLRHCEARLKEAYHLS